MSISLRNELRQRYGTTPTTPVPAPSGREQEPERAFVLHAESGRTVITAPLREVALANEGFMYLRGRFVEADRPNGNGALWTTEDLQLGEATVAGGPLNWLHDENKIIGALLDGQLLQGREAAAAEEGGIGNHIVSTAAMWQFLFPREASIIEKAAGDHGLYYSMECLSRTVACVDAPGRPGCGEEFSYGDYDAGQACAHLNARTSVRHFKNPFFLGGAVIVPPYKPGWGNANADVVRQAASAVEQADLQDVSITQAREVAAAVLQWANR